MSDLKTSLMVPKSLTLGLTENVLLRLAGTVERPLICLVDLCRLLSIGNPRMVAERLDEDEKGVSQTDTPGGPQEMLYVTEGGFYTVVVRSDKPNAKAFRKWVTGEVLPCIRKHGKYPAEAETPPPLSPAEALLASVQMLVEQEKRLKEQERRVEVIETRVECNERETEDAAEIAQAALDTASSNFGYYSIMAWHRLLRRDLTLREASRLGTLLTNLCRREDIRLGSVRDPRFGVVNTYPEGILGAHLGWPRSRTQGEM